MHADRKALACLIAGALCIGFAPIFVRLIDVGYTAAAFWRVALSVPVLWLLWYSRQQRDPEGSPARLRWLWLAGVFFAADLAVWHQSIRFTSVSVQTVRGDSPETSMQDLECRATLCRLEVSYKDPQSQAQLLDRIIESVGPLLPSTDTHTSQNEDGSTSMVVYLARQGHQFPRAD